MAGARKPITEPGLHEFRKGGARSRLDLQGETVVSMAGGGEHSVLVCQSGRVLSLGSNEDGQLGLSTDRKTVVSQPTLVAALSSTTISQVACGYYHTLFLSADGLVYVCGDNDEGQLGLGDIVNRPLPTLVTRLPLIKMVAAGGNHSVIVVVTGEVLVAGRNDHGQLGLGHRDPPTRFTAIPAIDGSVTQVLCGLIYTALVSNRSLFVSGLVNKEDNASLSFKRVALTSPVVAVSPGYNHIIVLTADGAFWSWGRNSDGQLGVGKNGDSSTPQTMVGLGDIVVKHVIAGFVATALITNEGALWVCGESHVLIHESSPSPNTPTLVSKKARLLVDQVAMSVDYTLVLVVPTPEQSGISISKSETLSQPDTGSTALLPLERAFLRSLECPVCYKTMCAPINMCIAGHSVCGTCRSRTIDCALCRQPYSNGRNFGLESLSADAQLPCTDCWERLPTNLLEEHGSVCTNRTHGCPVTTACAWTGRMSAMLDHVTSAHHDLVWLESPHSFTHRESTGGVVTNVLVAHDQVFQLYCKFDLAAREFHAAVVLLGPARDCPKYKYKVKLFNKSSDYCVSFCHPVLDCSHDARNIFNSINFIVSECRAICQYIFENNISCVVSIIKSTRNVKTSLP